MDFNGSGCGKIIHWLCFSDSDNRVGLYSRARGVQVSPVAEYVDGAYEYYVDDSPIKCA